MNINTNKKLKASFPSHLKGVSLSYKLGIAQGSDSFFYEVMEWKWDFLN